MRQRARVDGSFAVRLVPVIILVLIFGAVVIAPASATTTSQPLYVWKAPFTGPGSVSATNSSTGCNAISYTLLETPFFDQTNGHFGVSQYVNASGSPCMGASSASFTLDYDFSFVSNVSGPRILRSLWWIDWSANLTSTIPNQLHREYSRNTVAIFSWSLSESVRDLTLRAPAVGASYPGSVSRVDNSSLLVGHNLSLNLPLQSPYVLTKGHLYQVSITVSFGIMAEVQGIGNYSSARFSVGSAANPTELREIEFR